MNVKSFVFAFVCIVLLPSAALAASSRNWQTGTLMETEQQKVREGSTQNSNTDGSAKKRGDKTDYSQNTTTTKTDNFETYQIYTIEAGGKVYVAREHLLFPWSKPAHITVGEPVKLAIEKNKLYILDADEKEHKATVTKVSMKSAP
jgi:hypothetical protein